MKHITICLLLLIGTAYNLHAQDKIVLRNGRTIDVKVQRSLENRVEYTYPGETSVYERPKTAVSYILYEDGRKEICDESLQSSDRVSSRPSSSDRTTTSRPSSSSAKSNRVSDNNEISWQDVKTTFAESDVSEMTRLKRISAASNTSYKDAIQQLKKKAAAIGGTTILVMDDNGEDIEIMGVAYRDENMDYNPKNANERNTTPVESSSNIRRRRIAQQMESYNNESNIDADYSGNSRNTTPRGSSSSSQNTSSRDNTSSSRQTYSNEDSPDALYLMNGRVIRGTIEELEPDDFVSIRTPAGKIYEYSMDDVKRISRTANKSTTKKSSSASRNSSKYDDNEDEYSDTRSSSKYNNNDYHDNYKVSGYKGTFDVGYDLPIGGTGEKGNFEINTSHGYQINEYLFVGAGIGLHIYNARDSKMTDPSSYPQYIGTVSNGVIIPSDSVTYMRAVDSSYMTLPIFVDVRGYLPLQNSKITPFAMFRVGYSFNLSDSFGGMGLYINPAVGVKYQLSPMIGINFSIGYAYQSYGGIPKNGGYGYYYYKDAADKTSNTKYEAKGAGGLSLKLGIEF